LAPLAIVLRPFGLSYEVAVPLMIIIDPLADMVRTMLNVALNCMIPTLAGGRTAMDTTQSPQLVPQSDLESYIPKM
jgi:Na+/H+-dicarboxylate symporter